MSGSWHLRASRHGGWCVQYHPQASGQGERATGLKKKPNAVERLQAEQVHLTLIGIWSRSQIKMRLFPFPSSKSNTYGHLIVFEDGLSLWGSTPRLQSPCRRLLWEDRAIFKVQTREALLEVRYKTGAFRPLEPRSRAHGGSVKCLEVGKKPKWEGLVPVIGAAGSTVCQLKLELLSST